MIAAMWFITIMLLSPILSEGTSKDPYRELWTSSAGRVDEPIIVGGSEIVPESDLRNPQRRIWIITTGIILCPFLFMTTALYLFTDTTLFLHCHSCIQLLLSSYHWISVNSHDYVQHEKRSAFVILIFFFTACLPWLTGTSVNPLLRAAYLAKDRPKGRVTLMVPWLPREEQDIAYPPGVRFESPDEQREFVKKWLIEDAQLPLGAERLEILFYTARYNLP